MLSEVNPDWLGPGDYTAFLNRVFPGQWDLKAYDWYIARGFNGRFSPIERPHFHTADIVLLGAVLVTCTGIRLAA